MAMMKTLKRTLSIMMIVGMLLCAGCAHSPKTEKTPKAQEPPGNEAMVDLIGKTKEEVLTSLSLKETDLTEYSLYTYMTPLEITYQDVKMHILLVLAPIDEDSGDMCDGIWYLAEYHGEPERAAKEMLAVSKEIQAVFGTPDVGGKQDPAWEMTESELSAAITKGDMAKKYTWYMEKPVSDHMEDYINAVAKRPEYLQNQVPFEPGYLCELYLTAFTQEGEDTVSAYLHLKYEIGEV